VKATGTLGRECAAEFIGTYILVFFGTGSVHVAVLTTGLVGLWQVAVVWGVAISLAIYATSAVSGAHINPAVTLAFTAWRRFPARKVPLYVPSQLLGAVAAAATLYVLFHNILGEFELANGLVRGQPGSELSAMMYGEYFPNPALIGTTSKASESVTHLQAMLGEGIGTAFLAFFVFAVTDARNRNRPSGTFFAVFIGLTVAVVICIIAPLTQGGLNPARDFGPRLFSYFAGWKSIAIPGPRGGFFTVYILAPCCGALLGAMVYELVVAPGMSVATAGEPADRLEQGERTMHQVRLILVGGFLGAGKTTLLANAAARLAREGRRVGLITNDQATNLVDTGILERQGSGVQEVSGGCFCCRFGDLVSALKQLMKGVSPDVIIGEPVGSCTDISATVLQPLKEIYGELFRLAPFSVLVDPSRLRESLGRGARSRLPGSVLYIFRKQLEEADLILLNKADLLSSVEVRELEGLLAEQFPRTPVLTVSALEGDGVEAWLRRVLQDQPAGQRIAEVDYDTYAEGEAELGWLNASVELRADGGADWRAFCLDLVRAMQSEFQAASAEVAHLKLLLTAGGSRLVANLTSNDGSPFAEGIIEGAPQRAALLVNARVHLGPDALRTVVERRLRATAGDRVRETITSIQSFAPARPQPTHRFDSVV